ncbi:MAG: protein kinase [Syntrophaceticus schinkii]
MPSKIILKVTKGELAGKEFIYDSKEQLFIGRQDDCTIVLPDKSVSRYHCMLEVTPPDVTARDFGSLNGTYLNGKIIGQRERSVSVEDAQKEYHEEFELHDGDRLGLGKHCEILLHTVLAKRCANCGEELPDDRASLDGRTIDDDAPQSYVNRKGEAICEACHLQQEAEAMAADLERKLKQAADKAEEEIRQAASRKKCPGCGAIFTPQDPDNNLCPQCARDQGKVLQEILVQALGGILGQRSQKDHGPATIKGFRKVRKLGAGGMGAVWLVQDEKTGRQYALKTMLPEVAANKLAKDTFLREAMLGEALDHKNVIKVFKTGCQNGVFYILMELCEGGSVDKYMERYGSKLPLDIATFIVLQALDGLEYAHHANVSVKCGWRTRDSRGVVHRDFKPANIFLADNSTYPAAKVADFGLAKGFETAGLSKHTRTGTVSGTPVFQPRKQIANFKYAKPDVDVWAAAASYYYMLTANIPKEIKGKDTWLAMYTEKAVPIRQRDPQIPEKLAAVIDKALVETPDIGIQSARELKQQIVAALPDEVKKTVRGVI